MNFAFADITAKIMMSPIIPGYWRTPPGRSKAEILTALDKVIARAGAGHVAFARSTFKADDSGFACIQGELMRELGYSTSERSMHGTWGSVSDLLDPDGAVEALPAALMYAQMANDTGVAWGHIAKQMRYTLAA